jgi:transposase-like protein
VLSRAKEDAVPLVDLSMVEQRYDAVREVLDGATVKDTAIRYGVDRRTLHRWLVRYANEGLGALAGKSPKPDRCPHQMSPDIEARVVALRRSHPGWGPRTILNKLRRELEAPPSRSAIYRCLVRHRLIQPKPRRRRRDDYKRWERSLVSLVSGPRSFFILGWLSLVLVFPPSQRWAAMGRLAASPSVEVPRIASSKELTVAITSMSMVATMGLQAGADRTRFAWVPE